MPTASAFKLADAASYDEFAGDFEEFTERCTRPLAEAIVEFAALADARSILDVGCGTGVLTRSAANAVGDDGRVTGVDLSDSMLRIAAQRAAAGGLGDRISLQPADAERLPFPDAHFDRVLSLFALRHFPDPGAAVHEMYRVLRRGSRCVIGVGSGAPWLSSALPAVALTALKEQVARLFGREPLLATRTLDDLLTPTLGPESTAETASWTHGLDRFSRPVADLMRRAGFKSIQTRWVGQSSVIESTEEFWRLQLVFSSRARKRVPLASPDAQARLRAAFDTRCRKALSRGAKMIYRSGALIVAGDRPS